MPIDFYFDPFEDFLIRYPLHTLASKIVVLGQLHMMCPTILSMTNLCSQLVQVFLRLLTVTGGGEEVWETIQEDDQIHAAWT